MEGRSYKRPLLVDMRDSSSALESYSDLVIFLHRDECNQPASEQREGTCEALLVKNRRNKQSAVQLNFSGEFGLWSDFH
jgi:replicative DNA helicase